MIDEDSAIIFCVSPYRTVVCAFYLDGWDGKWRNRFAYANIVAHAPLHTPNTHNVYILPATNVM